MAVNWSRTMLGAAGAGGSNEFYIQGQAPGSPASFYYNEWHNVVVNQNTGHIYGLRRKRYPGNPSGSYEWDKFNNKLEIELYNNYSNSQVNKLQYGRPKIDHDTSNTYDIIEPSGGSSAGDVYYTTTGNGSSPYGNHKNYGMQYVYTPNSWRTASYIKHYTIGDRSYAIRGYNQNGGSAGGWEHDNASFPFGLLDGHSYTSNSAPGNGSFVEMFPINASSQSTNHLVWYSSPYNTDAYILDSDLNKTGSNNARSHPAGHGNQYWSTGAIDRTNNTMYMEANGYLYAWDYVNNTANKYQITGMSGSVRGQSNWLCVVNGYLYQFIASSSGGLYLVKYNTNNITSGISSYRISSTTTYGAPSQNYVGNQGGFLVEGPNSYTGDSDLLALGFDNPTDNSGSFKDINLAICKWDTIPSIATHANQIAISNASISLGSATPWGTSGNPPGSDSLGTYPQNGPNNFSANYYPASPPFPPYWGNSSSSTGPINL